MDAINTQETQAIQLHAEGGEANLTSASLSTDPEALTIHGTTASATAAQQQEAQRFQGLQCRQVTVAWRNPKRSAVVNVNAEAWTRIEHIDESYKPILVSALTNAAERIIKRYCQSFSIIPSGIPAGLLTPDAIFQEATYGAMDWMSKEELESAWLDSATRKQWTVDKADLYKSNSQFRKQVHYYAEQIQALAARNANPEHSILDMIQAKLHADDLSTSFGQFVMARCEQLRNKPEPEMMPTDLL